MRIINASETGTLVLGYQGEDQRLVVRFPLVDEKTGRKITDEFPGGSFSISIMLPGDPAEHIVGSEDFRVEENWLIWTVKEAYTVGFGEGKLQLNYAFGGMVKSRIWKTNVRKSINSGSGTVPSWSDWKTELLTAAAAVQSAVDSYDEMTAEAEELPAGSTPTAEMDHTGDHPVLKLGIPASQGGGGDVQSVNGKTGVVVLNANDVGALPASTPIPPAVTVDSELSGTSVNPVQNKIIKAALDSQSETIVESTGFLEANDFDADVGGKVNVLAVPYAYDDFMHGYMIFSNGTIGTQEQYSVSALIPVSEGTYGLKTKHDEYSVGDIAPGNNYKNGFTFFAADGTTLVSRGEDMISLGNDIYVMDVPQDAKYVRFCIYSSELFYRQTAVGFFNQWILLPDADTTITDDFFVLGYKKADGTINKIMRRDGSHLTIVDTEAREDVAEALARPITFGRRSFAVFEKVCCIGDSYTSGYMVDTGDQSYIDGAYSWVEHLKNMTGREYVNLGIGGATTASWLTSASGLAKMQLPANKSQAYIVALQINDAAQGLTVGTIEDIGTSAQTYYGCTSKIIDEIFDVNSDAHVFLLTQPKNFVGEHTPYRNAILAIVEWYQENGTHQNQVHLIDLLDYWKLFTTPGISMYGGHFTAVGYECVAEILLYAFSNYINENVTKFQDVFLIDWGGKGGNIPCTGLAISEQTAQISNTGTAVTLTATPTPADTTDTLTWESSDPTIVSVTNGTLTPLGVGTVTITARCGEQTATCAVTSRWFMDGADVNKVLSEEIIGVSAVDGGDGRPTLNSSNWYSSFCALTGQYSYYSENDKYPYPIPKGATKVKVSTNNSDVVVGRAQWFNLATENPNDSGVCNLIGTSQRATWTQSGTNYTIDIPQYQGYPSIDGVAVSVVGDQNYMDQSRTDAVVIEFLAS